MNEEPRTTSGFDVRTAEERDRVVNLLLMFARSGFRLGDPAFQRELLQMPDLLRALFTDALNISEGTGSGTGVAERCERFKKELSSMPMVRLEIAFEPDDELVGRIVAALRRSSGRHVVLDIAVIPSLIGGCRVSYEGRYKDFSVKNVVAEFFRNDAGPDAVGVRSALRNPLSS